MKIVFYWKLLTLKKEALLFISFKKKVIWQWLRFGLFGLFSIWYSILSKRVINWSFKKIISCLYIFLKVPGLKLGFYPNDLKQTLRW
jgi:hypothetical protein